MGFVLRDKVDYLKKYPFGLKPTVEEMGHTTEFVKCVPILLNNPESLSPDENIRTQDLLISELFKTYWMYLQRKTEIITD